MEKIRLARRFFSMLPQVVDGKGNKATFFLLRENFVRKAGNSHKRTRSTKGNRAGSAGYDHPPFLTMG
jgi:hypothetical protein